MTKAHFVEWQNQVDETKGERGEQWRRQQLIPVGAVLKAARKLTEWTFPPELDHWLEVFEYKKPKPHKRNRTALSVEHFHELLAKAEEWANIDVHEYADSLPLRKHKGSGTKRGRAGMPHLARANNVKQANRVKRVGVQWSAVLRLAVQCGCDNSDICNLTYNDLILNGNLPLFTLSRSKTNVDRYTPLLPSTIAAINRWREYEEPRTEFVFSNDGKKQYKSEKIAENFDRLREACEILDGVWFKHFRNAGGTVGRNNRRTKSEIEAFLGHDVDGQCVFYMDDTPDDYLVPVVNLIGAEYFDGEQISD